MAVNTLLTSTPTPRDERGRYLEKPANLPVLTSAKAREAAQIRWDRYRKASAKGIMKEAIAIDPTVQTPADAYALVVGKQYVTLMDSDKPKMDDVYRLGQIIGALPTAHDKVQESGAITAVMEGVLDLTRVWLDVMQAQRQDASVDTVDGTVTAQDSGAEAQDTAGEGETMR